MNPCFSPLELSSAAGGGCGPQWLLGGLFKHHAVRALGSGFRPAASKLEGAQIFTPPREVRVGGPRGKRRKEEDS